MDKALGHLQVVDLFAGGVFVAVRGDQHPLMHHLVGAEQADRAEHAQNHRQQDEPAGDGVVVFVKQQQRDDGGGADAGHRAADGAEVGKLGALHLVGGDDVAHGAVGHIDEGAHDAPDEVDHQHPGHPQPVGHRFHVEEHDDGEGEVGQGEPFDPGFHLAPAAGRAVVAGAADEGVVEGVQRLADEDDGRKVGGVQPHDVDAEQHEVAVHQRLQAVEAQVPQQVAQLVAQPELGGVLHFMDILGVQCRGCVCHKPNPFC